MARREPTGWVGWVYFASAMMLLVGGMGAIQGLAALFNHSYYVVTQKGLLALNFTAWGWVHLIVGTLIFLAGIAVLSGRLWGRVVGVFLAILSALVNIAFLDAYPIWAIIAITIDVLVIYALTMHGLEVRD